MSQTHDARLSMLDGERAPLPADHPPVLLVVVDTEEEFDWYAEPDRSATTVTFARNLDRLHSIFDEFGIVPTYVIDYPVAEDDGAASALRRLADGGKATIGAHLHPWVNPPFEEAVTRRNTYPGNLPGALEAEKLRRLGERIAERFGEPPSIYKAGRYGVGENTAAVLGDLGFEIDLSVCPHSDYSADGGPDFTAAPSEPYWFGGARKLLEIPLSLSFTGWATFLAEPIYRFATRAALAPLRLPAILSRTRALDRLMLSPEGFTGAEHRRLTRSLLDRGVRVFTWSFHSSSLVPGGAPYVKSESDLDDFLRTFRDYFEFFLHELGGVPMTPRSLKQRLETAR